MSDTMADSVDVHAHDREIPAGEMLVLESRGADLDSERFQRRHVVASAPANWRGGMTVNRYAVTAGWRCAGSVTVWRNGHWLVGWQMHGAEHGRTHEAREEAEVEFRRITTKVRRSEIAKLDQRPIGRISGDRTMSKPGTKRTNANGRHSTCSFIEYDWTFCAYRYRFGDMLTDFRGTRSCESLDEWRSILEPAGLQIGPKRDSRLWDTDWIPGHPQAPKLGQRPHG